MKRFLYIILPLITKTLFAATTISYPDSAIIGSNNKDYSIDIISGNGLVFGGVSKNHIITNYDTAFRYDGTNDVYNITAGGTVFSLSGISNDGSVISMNSSDGTRRNGYVYKNDGNDEVVFDDIYTGNHYETWTAGVSNDGIVLYNVYDDSSTPPFVSRVFTFNKDGNLREITTSLNEAFGYAISKDSSTIVGGYMDGLLQKAFKYKESGITDLDSLADFTNGSYAVATSANGSVTVGNSYDSLNKTHAFINIESNTSTTTDLGTLPAFVNGNYEASGVSDNGAVVVGHVSDVELFSTGIGYLEVIDAPAHAFKYDVGTAQMTDLGVLSGNNYSEATAMSADGSIIVGRSGITGSTNNDRAFKYKDGQMASLGNLGISSRANDISADGSIIVGSYKTNEGNTRGFIYRSSNPDAESNNGGEGNMVDRENTYISAQINAAKINSMINLKSAVLNNSLNQDCNKFGSNNFCLGISTRYSAVNKNNFTQDYSGILRVAYKINPLLRVGFSLDQQAADHNPAQISISNKTPMSSIFANISQNKDGSGLNFKIAASYNKANINATRELLYGSEAGSGSAGLNSKGILASISQSFKLKNKFQIIPSIGIRHTELNRNGYTENSDISFPVSYDKFKQKTTAAILALNLSMPVAKDTNLMIGGGMEHNLSASLDNYSGKIQSLPSFSYKSSNLRTNRAFFNGEISYDFANNQRISSSLFYGKQQLNNANSTMVYFNYSLGF